MIRVRYRRSRGKRDDRIVSGEEVQCVKTKETVGKMAMFLILLLWLAGCGRQEAVGEAVEDSTGILQAEKQGNPAEQGDVQNEAGGQEENAGKKIPVDFPFEEPDSFQLTLVRPEESAGEYELRLYDKNRKLLQAIPCGVLTEPVQSSHDDLIYGGECLQIFPADSDMGLLFEWNSAEGRFSDHTIRIPKYVENQKDILFSSEEDNVYQIKKIYQLNFAKKCADEIRSWKLQKDTGKLVIWDELEEKSLFEGAVELNEEGNPLNIKYYDMLFREDCYRLWDYKEDSTVRIWLDDAPEKGVTASQGFARIQKELFGEDGYSAEYESTEEFLTDFGVEDDSPVYQYRDQYDNLQLELYKDGSSEQFLGIVYEYNFDNVKKKWTKAYGFTINNVREEEWEDRDIFGARSVYGEDVMEYVYDPEVTIQYTPSGQIDHYCLRRMAEREVDGEIKDTMCTALEMDYIYRDDSTLFYRDYRHDPYLFSTTLSTLRSFYDEEGRVIYESGYITHGKLEYYYIYDDKREIPMYCLCIDHDLGYAVPDLVRYE